jgi:hypothetical protein
MNRQRNFAIAVRLQKNRQRRNATPEKLVSRRKLPQDNRVYPNPVSVSLTMKPLAIHLIRPALLILALPALLWPGSNATAQAGEVPLTWSESENILWQQPLTGNGSAGPVIHGDRLYLVGYRGYGEQLIRDMNEHYRDGSPRRYDKSELTPGKMEDLAYWVQARDLETGELIWEKTIPATKPRHPFEIFLPWHGYASATPAVDDAGVVAFFGAEGVFAFGHAGQLQWHASVGDGVHRWGSGSSPVIVCDLVVVNACPESETLYGFERASGKERWRTPGMDLTWATPAIMDGPEGPEIVISMKNEVAAYSPRDGRRLWHCKGIPDYISPTPLIDGNVAYVIGGRGDFAQAVKRGGEILWKAREGSNVSSPVLHKGHLYFADEQTTHVYCLDAATGEAVYEQRVDFVTNSRGEKVYPMFYATPVVAGDRIYLVSRQSGTFVLPAEPRFEILAHNVIEGDDTIWNATPATQNGRLYLRSGKALYCIGQ